MGFLASLTSGWGLSAAVTAPAVPIASPWADSTALEVATWAGLLDAVDCLPVSRAQAIALPTVARGRDLIAPTIGRLPFWAANADGRLPIQPAAIAQPEVGRSRFLTLTWTVDCMLFYGFAAWLVTERYAEDQRPRRFRYIPRSAMDLDGTTGEIVSVFGQPVRDPSRDVVRFDGPHEGLLARGAETIRAARSLAIAYAKATRQPVPAVELHQTSGDPLSDTEIAKLIQSWVTARNSANGQVGYTSPNLEAKMHGTQPEQLFIAGRKDSSMDLVHHMGLPAWAADVPVEGSSLTYSNVPSRARELIDYTLAGYIEAITSRLSLDDILPRGIWSTCSTDVLTDGDFGERMTAGKTAVDGKIYTPEQIAARERGVPLEGPLA